ncbi:MAG: aminodeoxychorismate/anthranilate synthase component II, partial [Verrucomicrobia bacterium]|nr:aminodeoxychorismate/anthranilate synthase component II [Verrucomicrobiota bacterium]
MKILIIDNYDSFTGNLVQLLAQTTRTGPIVVRNDTVSLATILDISPDAIVISPGPGRPENTKDFGVCAEVIRHVDVPILGVCLGFQGIAHAFGASVQAAAFPLHGARSAISHIGLDLFDQMQNPFDAVRYHSLEVSLPPAHPSLIPLAHADDGTLMALRHASRPIWGVQFHPESIGTQDGASLIE